MAVIVRLLGGEAGERLPSLAGTFLVVEKPVCGMEDGEMFLVGAVAQEGGSTSLAWEEVTDVF